MFSGRDTLFSWKMRGCFGVQSMALNLWLRAPEASSTARSPLRRMASPTASPEVTKCGHSQFWHELTVTTGVSLSSSRRCLIRLIVAYWRPSSGWQIARLYPPRSRDTTSTAKASSGRPR